MASYSVAEAKNRLPSLINKAMSGEEVVITRHGKPVVEIRPKRATTPEELAAIDAWLDERAKARPVSVSTLDVLQALRDEKPW